MQHLWKILILAMTGAMLLAVVGCNDSSSSKEDVTVRMLHTTDVHGSLFPYDFINNETVANSLASTYTYVKQQRAAFEHVILLDAGDILQGQPITNYYNYEVDLDTTENAVASVMNYMRYDAGAVGNHDIEPGPAVYKDIIKEFNFPWLSANTISTETGELSSDFPAYTIIEKGDAKIAVIGLTTPGIPKWLPQQQWEGYEFEDMIETAKYWVNFVQENEDPDVIVGLFHSGVDFTYGGVTADTPKNENASVLVAQQVPGFDVVYVGHDHQDHNDIDEESGVLIMGARNAARTVTAVTVDLTWNDETDKYDVALTGELISPEEYEPDPDFLAEFNPQFEETKAYVEQPVGTFTESSTSRDAMFGDSSFNDIIHDLQMTVAKNVLDIEPDMSFAAPLQFDVTIDAGPIFVSDMYKLYKYENYLYVMELTGAEIKGAMEYSYEKWVKTMTGPGDHLLNFTEYDEATGNYDLAARYYNYDSTYGVIYDVDVSKPAGERVIIHSLKDGTPFELGKTYRVAVNSYRGGGGGGHLTEGAGIPKEDLDGRTIARTGRDLRYFLQQEITEQGEVTPVALGNWKFIPEDWAAAGAARDYPILYPEGGGVGH